MKQLSAAAVERAMKLPDVMLRAMAKRITYFQAADLGISCGRCSVLNHFWSHVVGRYQTVVQQTEAGAFIKNQGKKRPEC